MTCMAAELAAVRELDRMWCELAATPDPAELARYRELRIALWAALCRPPVVVEWEMAA